LQIKLSTRIPPQLTNIWLIVRNWGVGTTRGKSQK
jgi:hypothetical protein